MLLVGQVKIILDKTAFPHIVCRKKEAMDMSTNKYADVLIPPCMRKQKVTSPSSAELFRALKRLREKTPKCSAFEIDNAREEYFKEKYERNCI